MKKIMTWAFLLIVVSVTEAQAKIWAESDVLKKVELASPKIEKSLSMKQEFSEKRKEAFADFLPTVSAISSYLLNKKYMFLDMNLGAGTVSIPQKVPTASYGLQANYVLFQGFGGTNRLVGSDLMYQAATHDYDWSKFSVLREARLQFFRSLAAVKIREASEHNVDVLNKHLNDIKNLKMAGLATRYDLLRTESQLTDAQSEMLAAKDQENLMLDKLAEMLDEEKIEGIRGEIPQIQWEESDFHRTDGQIARKDLTALHERAEASRKFYYSATSHWFPRVSLNGQYLKYNNINDNFYDDSAIRDSYQIGVLLTWNLFEGGSSDARSSQAYEQYQQNLIQERERMLHSRQDLEYWRRRLRQQIFLRAAKQSNVDRSQESLRLAQEGRKVGARTNADILDAELDLFRSQTSLVNASLGIVEAVINLELATGKNLFDELRKQ